MVRTSLLSAALAAALLAGAAAPVTALPAPESARAAAATITEPRTRSHVEFLASDLLEGRSTPSRGLDIAASYIAAHFARLGLTPGGDDGSFFQGFPLLSERKLATQRLALAGPQGKALRPDVDFTPLPMSGSGKVSGALVFAGYGITAPEEKYDDYEGLDVKGKVVIVLRKEPRAALDGEAFSGKRTTRHAYFQSKVANAARRGAAAILVVNGPLNAEERPLDQSWPQRGEGMSGGGREGGDGTAIPAFQISPEAVEALLAADLRNADKAPEGGRLKALQVEIDAELAPRSFEALGVRLEGEVAIEDVASLAKNVVGVLPGADPELKAEAVVFGAHYDHVGVQSEKGASFYGQIGPAKDGDRIHNGADDNASGTSALLEVARAFAESGARPARTVIFVAFAGEELGLLGSQHYARSPFVPNDRTVAMLNMDMVGRNALDKVFLGGTRDTVAMERALNEANALVGMSMERMAPGPLDGASDHASFQAVGIPSVFFFSGDHPDYHRVSDHADKIDAEKIARIARLAYLTGADLADDPKAGEDRAIAAKELETRQARRGRRNRPAQGTPAPETKPAEPKRDGVWF